MADSWESCPDSWETFPDSWETLPDSWDKACDGKGRAHRVHDLQRGAEEDIAAAAQRDDLLLQIVELGGERERSDDIRAQLDALDDGHLGVVVDEADLWGKGAGEGDEEAGRRGEHMHARRGWGQW